jgi:hypothetical protein
MPFYLSQAAKLNSKNATEQDLAGLGKVYDEGGPTILPLGERHVPTYSTDGFVVPILDLTN